MLPRQCRLRATAAIAIFCPLLLASLPPQGNSQSADPLPSAEWQAFQQTVQPFLAKHCFECHADKKSSGVRLDLFQDAGALAKGLPTIEKALEALRKQAMPPKKRPRPKEDEVAPVLSWLGAFVARIDRQTPAP